MNIRTGVGIGIAAMIMNAGCATQQVAQTRLEETPAVVAPERSVYIEKLNRGLKYLNPEQLEYVAQIGGITRVRGLDCPPSVESHYFSPFMVPGFVEQAMDFDKRYTSAQK